MASEPLWFVRAGEKATFAKEFRSAGFVGIGWRDVGEILPDTPDAEIDRRFAETSPDKEENARNVWANQIRRYLREIKVGDRVATYDAIERAYLLGTIESDARWVEGHPLPRQRSVTWTHTVDRDSLSENSRNKLGSIATLFRVGVEADEELQRNAMVLVAGGTPAITVRGRRAPGLAAEDFDVLARHPRSVPWPSLPSDVQSAIKGLRQRLLSYAVTLKEDLDTTVTLKAFASHTAPSGRNASLYWSCVYPQTAPNKSFAFQLFVIVRAGTVEFGFGSGSGTAEVEQDRLDELSAQFDFHKERLRRLRDLSWVATLGDESKAAGFGLRARWSLSEAPPRAFESLAEWIDFATSADGGGAAVSRTLNAAEALAHGDRFADYLVEQLQRFVPLLEAIYSEAPRSPELPLAMPRPGLTLEWLSQETLWTRSDLEAVIDALTGTSPQIILAGPPGTGKTWIAELLARYLTQDRPDHTKTVQFHPSYSYEEFVEGLRPTVQNGGLSFQPHKGVLLRFCGSASPDDVYRVLVVDEMNRANLPRVFGELLYLLEYRDRPIDLQYSSAFRMPKRLLLIGTMNTADRSIRSIDVALRRRFDVFECVPDPTILERYYASHVNEVPDLVAGFGALNAALADDLDRHHTIGHAFFMADPMTPSRLQHVWRHKVGPLLEEYFFDQADVARKYEPRRFWPSLDSK